MANIKMGHGQDIISANISEFVKEGHSIKEAIAKAMAHAHKCKMMGESEEISDEQGDIGGTDDGGFSGSPINEKYESNDHGLSESTLDEESLAKGLQAQKYKANDNTVEYSAGKSSPDGKIKMAGLLQGDRGKPQGNKPDESAMPSATGEPMSEEMKAAIFAKKAKRRFS